MAGETNVNILLESMQPVLQEGEFVFCTVPPSHRPSLRIFPVGQFLEDEGMTLILKREEAEHCRLSYDYVSRMITLSVHSSLSAVGFLAAIATRLAEQGISVNPVSAYYHDHLFVPSNRAEDAMQILMQFSRPDTD